jgi:hypothetical protein
MARLRKGVFSWEDVLAHRYQSESPVTSIALALSIHYAFYNKAALNTSIYTHLSIYTRVQKLTLSKSPPDNKPPPLAHPRHASSPHTPQSQPQCALLTCLSPELRLIIWEMVLGGQRLHIIQRSGQRLGHVICPLCPGGGGGAATGTGTRSSSGPRSRLDFSSKIKIARGVGDSDRDTFCEICQGAGIAQPVKEGDSWGVGCAGRNGNGLLGLVLTCRQMYG